MLGGISPISFILFMLIHIPIRSLKLVKKVFYSLPFFSGRGLKYCGIEAWKIIKFGQFCEIIYAFWKLKGTICKVKND